jgi:hypothetical protein
MLRWDIHNLVVFLENDWLSLLVALQKNGLGSCNEIFLHCEGGHMWDSHVQRMNLIVWVRDGLAPIPLTLTIFPFYVGLVNLFVPRL